MRGKQAAAAASRRGFDEVQRRAELAESEAARLAARIDVLGSQLAELQSKYADETRRLREAVMEAEGPTVRSLQSVVEGLRQERDELTAALEEKKGQHGSLTTWLADRLESDLGLSRAEAIEVLLALPGGRHGEPNVAISYHTRKGSRQDRAGLLLADRAAGMRRYAEPCGPLAQRLTLKLTEAGQ
jgi:DNA repair exonuclease SbcCD ATPase subunit